MNGENETCELPGCKNPSMGVYQVYDDDTPTMNRPARMCVSCMEFANECGMTVVKEGYERRE
jgi:hypothetical protein